MQGPKWPVVAALAGGFTAGVGLLADSVDVTERIWPTKTSAAALYADASDNERALSSEMRPPGDRLIQFEKDLSKREAAGLSRADANRERAVFYHAHLTEAGPDSKPYKAAIDLIGLYERHILLVEAGEVDGDEFASSQWGLSICTIGTVLGNFIADQDEYNSGTHKTFVNYYESLPCDEIIAASKNK